jgi:hypothetical protein
MPDRVRIRTEWNHKLPPSQLRTGTLATKGLKQELIKPQGSRKEQKGGETVGGLTLRPTTPNLTYLPLLLCLDPP